MVKSWHAITIVLLMFKYLNLNPTRRHVSDCVCRAMSLAMRKDYWTTKDMLARNGIDFDCDQLTLDCYSGLLSDMGYEMKSADGKTVDEVAADYPNDIVLVRIDGHLTCCINGDCYDIWDCTEKPADKYWIVE